MTSLERLDYEGDELLMLVSSDVERTKRITACAKERETVAFIESMEPNSVFFDIGANCGSYTLLALSRGHTVVAFEASIPNFHRLNDNIRLNGFKAQTIAVPLWKKKEEIGWISAGEEPGTALHSIGPDGTKRLAFPLDFWTDPGSPIEIPTPDYIKLDVDGCELEVIQGAVRTLRTVKKVQVELDVTVKSHERIPGVLNTLGFVEESRHPHGNSGVSNVVFGRR